MAVVSGPLIRVALTGPRSGYLIAAIPPEGEERLPPSRQTCRGPSLVVGDVYRVSPDGAAEVWRAWLWPVAGGAVSQMQSCDAVDAISAERLGVRVQKRADKDGPWWGGQGQQRREGAA